MMMVNRSRTSKLMFLARVTPSSLAASQMDSEEGSMYISTTSRPTSLKRSLQKLSGNASEESSPNCVSTGSGTAPLDHILLQCSRSTSLLPPSLVPSSPGSSSIEDLYLLYCILTQMMRKKRNVIILRERLGLGNLYL